MRGNVGCRSSHGQDVILTSRYIIETAGRRIGRSSRQRRGGKFEKIRKKTKDKYREIVVGVTDGQTFVDANQHRVAPITSIIVPSR